MAVTARAYRVGVNNVCGIRKEGWGDFGLKIDKAHIKNVRVHRRTMRRAGKIPAFDGRRSGALLGISLARDDEITEIESFHDMPARHRVDLIPAIDEEHRATVGCIQTILDLCLKHDEAHR